MTTIQLPEYVGPDTPGRLGRYVEHDPRSRRYGFPTEGITIAPVRWARHGEIFEQGNLGSCTGNAAAGALLTDPLYAGPTPGLTIDEAFAVAVYADATALDAIPGAYPPQDTGSTGLAAAKALKARGLVSGYLHTFAYGDFLKALSVGPVLVGLSWYSSFDAPDRNGLVKIASSAYVRGGHEIYADEITGDGRIGFTNSWGPTWGARGRFYASNATAERLLAEQGDVISLVPDSAPPPAPAPAPTSAPEDAQLWAAMRAWALAKGL